MRTVIRSLVLLNLLIMTFLANADSSRPRVNTQLGVIEGKTIGVLHVFLGIPYTAPPTGDLRWKPPAPPARWRGVRRALAFGARCMQGRIYGDMIFRDPGGSEDCLSLNVWTPAQSAGAKLPVMVWIHGGGFVAGASSEPRQDGQHLAGQGVLVVSMNYRLGVFGFLVHPELTKESGRNSSGNYGLLDQLAALQWVQQNISAFGGDPDNVTIFGESAGSFSVSALMASPLAKNLFQKAIGESGAAFSNGTIRFAPRSVRQGKDLNLLNSTLGVQTLAELRSVPAEKLLRAFSTPETALAFDPDIDGYFLPESVPEIFAAGKQNDVPLLAGWNRNEAGYESILGSQEPTVENMKVMAQKAFGDRDTDFVRVYPTKDDAQARHSAEDFASDRYMGWSTWRWIEAQSSTGRQPVYRYRFDLAPPTDPKDPQWGAYHSAEIEYVFGQLDSKPHMAWRASDRQLSADMQKYWANFARTGDPDGPGLSKWPAYSSSDGRQVMHLDEHSEPRKDDQRDRYLFLTKAWEQ